MVFLRHGACVIGQDEARELAGNALGFQNVHGRLADEVRLLAPDGPAHSGFRRVCQAVGVLADDNVALFQAQYALGLDAHGPDAERLARRHRLVPEFLAPAGGDVDFVAQVRRQSRRA